MLVKEEHVKKIEIFNFHTLHGNHVFEGIKENMIVGLAADWALGKIRLCRSLIFRDSPLSYFCSVRVTVSNPKLFMDHRDEVLIERRIYRSKKIPSEFFYNRNAVHLAFIKDTLSMPYDEETLLFLEKLSRMIQ